jgi:hypothetical protein
VSIVSRDEKSQLRVGVRRANRQQTTLPSSVVDIHFLFFCRYMGTIVGISDVDPLRWPGSKWRNIQVA